MDASCLAASYQDDCRCPARRCRRAANRRCAQVSRRSLGGATRRRRRRWPGHPLHAAHCTLRTAHSSCTLAYANRPPGATCRVLPTSSQHSSSILSPSLPVSWSGCRPRRHPPPGPAILAFVAALDAAYPLIYASDPTALCSCSSASPFWQPSSACFSCHSATLLEPVLSWERGVGRFVIAYYIIATDSHTFQPFIHPISSHPIPHQAPGCTAFTAFSQP
jgi:hypothetical protein